MHDPIKTRLTGKQASIDGILKTLRQHNHQGPWARIEVRYSPQGTPAVTPQSATQAIGNALREGGTLASISVREHESNLDKASGDLVLRLFPAAPARQAPASPAQAAAPWWHALLRWLPQRWQPRPAGAPAPAQPDVSAAKALDKLQQAVKLAGAFIETDGGSAIAGAHLGNAPVGQARVLVRDASLDAALKPLIADDLTGAASAIGEMVASQRLRVAPGFAVSYQFRPRTAGDGTRYGADNDIEVVLRAAVAGSAGASATPAPSAAPASGRSVLPLRQAQAGRVEPTLDGSSATSAGPAAAPASATLLPQRGTLLPQAGTLLPKQRPPALLVLRVLGTTAQAFERPFELRFDALPARFDRDTLAQAGFGQRHGDQLLRLASNNSPLTIQRNASQQPVIHASSRAWPQGGTMPMYHDADTLAALEGELPLPADGRRIIVNAPGGVLDPASGQLLPALVIDLLPGPALRAVGGTPPVAQAA